jgi:hypothetical protein
MFRPWALCYLPVLSYTGGRLSLLPAITSSGRNRSLFIRRPRASLTGNAGVCSVHPPADRTSIADDGTLRIRPALCQAGEKGGTMPLASANIAAVDDAVWIDKSKSQRSF